MDINDFLQLLTNPQAWPLFLIFLAGYVMMRVMFKKDRVKSFSELEKVLVSFGVGFLFEYFLFYPIVALATFWWPLFRDGAYMLSVFLFCAISAVALLFRINGDSETEIIKGSKKLLTLLLVSLSAFEVFGIIVGYTAMGWYESYNSLILSDSWRTYIGLTLISFVLVLIGSFFAWTYLFKPLLEEKLEVKMPKLTKRNSALGVAFIMLAVIPGVLIVPLDRYLSVFTPKMEATQEVFSSAMQYEGSPMVLFIQAKRISQTNISTTYQFYALMEKSYKITLPRISLLSSVYISNPSNTSFLKGENRPFVSFSDSWKQLYVNVPPNVSYKFDVQEISVAESKVVGVITSFENFTGGTSFLANLTYWQEIPQPAGIEAEYLSPSYTDLGNQTWLEEHTFRIKNSSNKFLYISALEFDRFAFAIVHRNSTEVYRNGDLVPYAELVTLNRLSLGMYLNPGFEMNMTVSFIVDEIS